jgi:hypothetical protein
MEGNVVAQELGEGLGTIELGTLFYAPIEIALIGFVETDI